MLFTALRQRRAPPIGQEVWDGSPLHLSLACTSVCSSALPKSRGKAGCLYYPQDASAVFENRLGQACPGRRRLYKFPMCADWEEGPLLPASLLSTSSICRRLAMGHHPPGTGLRLGHGKLRNDRLFSSTSAAGQMAGLYPLLSTALRQSRATPIRQVGWDVSPTETRGPSALSKPRSTVGCSSCEQGALAPF